MERYQQMYLSIPKRLSELSLGGNPFDRQTIPAEFGHIPKLLFLNLKDSNLIGTVPKSFEHLTKLEGLYLGDNELVGEIPFLHDSLRVLKVENNQFTGFRKPLETYEAFFRVDGNKFVCDCHLTSWFGGLFSRDLEDDHLGNVLENEDSVLCANVNSFGGMPISLLRYSFSTPCSHPKNLEVAEPEQSSVTLSWDLGTKLEAGQELLENALDGQNCWDCSALDLNPRDENRPYQIFSSEASFFEISFSSSRSLSQVEKRCCSAVPFLNNVTNRIEYPMTGLHSFTTYEFTIRMVFSRFDLVTQSRRISRFSAGPSTWPSTFRTKADVPGTAPRQVKIATRQDDQMFIQWSAPDELNGYLNLYQVAYRLVSTESSQIEGNEQEQQQAASLFPSSEQKESFVTTSNPFVSLLGLAPSSTYAVRLRASTAAGWGPFSDDVLFSTLGTCDLGSEKKVTEGDMTCVPCDIGFYRSASERVCTVCPDMFPVTLTNGTDDVSKCTTIRGFFKDFTSGSTPIAKPCGEGMICEQNGIDSATLVLEPGYWRESNQSLDIIECRKEAYCQQTSLSAPLCTNHHTGVQCLACEANYAIKELDGVCELCSSEDLDKDASALIGWAILLLILMMGGVLRVFHVARKASIKKKLIEEMYASMSRANQQKLSKNSSIEEPNSGTSKASTPKAQVTPSPRSSDADMESRLSESVPGANPGSNPGSNSCSNPGSKSKFQSEFRSKFKSKFQSEFKSKFKSSTNSSSCSCNAER